MRRHIMNKQAFILLIFFSITLLFPGHVYSQEEILYESYKYTMGDNDTRSDAKRIALIEAKRRIVEKAGVYIESQSTITNFNLTNDEIKSYAAALLKVEIEKEEFIATKDSQTFIINIKAVVNNEDILNNLKKIKEDKSLQKKILDQQKYLSDLEKKWMPYKNNWLIQILSRQLI